MDNNLVLLERRDAVAVVTMNVPEKRNALSVELYTRLARTLNDLQDDLTVRALVLNGGRHFCAGGDMSLFELSPLEMRNGMQVGHRTIRALTGGRLPVVAAVEGTAYGAGLSIALACDFVVADTNASFCAAFGRIGLVPDYGLLWTLPQRVGTAKAREIMMLSDTFDATKAHTWGLVDRLVNPGTVLDAALGMAERLAAAPPGSIATIKSALSRAPLPLDALLAWEADTQALLVCTDDVQEGVRAFREKRPAKFQGR